MASFLLYLLVFGNWIQKLLFYGVDAEVCGEDLVEVGPEDEKEAENDARPVGEVEAVGGPVVEGEEACAERV